MMIRQTRVLGALATGLMTTIAPLAFAHAQDTASAEKEVAAVEEAYSQSFVTGDTSVAQRYVSDDFVGLEPDGKTADKASILKDVASEPRPKVLRIPAIIVRNPRRDRHRAGDRGGRDARDLKAGPSPLARHLAQDAGRMAAGRLGGDDPAALNFGVFTGSRS